MASESRSLAQPFRATPGALPQTPAACVNSTWHRKAAQYLLSVALVIGVAAGCTTMRSTALTMTGDGWLVGQSNGTDKRFGMARPYRGVPVKLSVPAYLHVTVGENVYLHECGDDLVEFKMSRPDRWVHQEILNAEKVFIVDFARPISGSGSLSLNFNPNTGYFTTVGTSGTDTSITDIGALVGTAGALLIPKIPKTVTTGTNTLPPPLREQLIIDQRVVAEQIFDLADCDLDAQVATFIETHVNCGHSCDDHAGLSDPMRVHPRQWQSPEVIPPPASATEPLQNALRAARQQPPMTTKNTVETRK